MTEKHKLFSSKHEIWSFCSIIDVEKAASLPKICLKCHDTDKNLAIESEKWSIKTSTNAYTCTKTCMHTRSMSHTKTHTSEKQTIVSQINTGNTGKVQYIHVIYPEFIKQNKGRDHAGSKCMQKSTALL